MIDALPGVSRPRHQFRLLCLGTAALLIVMLLLLSSGLDFDIRRTISDVTLILGGLATAASCGHRVPSAQGGKRRTWLLLALAGVAAATGNTWIFASHLRGGTEPALADGFFAVALLLGIASLITFPAVQRRGLDLARILFDGIVIGGSLLSILGITLVPQLLAAPGSTSGSRTVSLVSTVIDIMLATLAAMLVLRGDRADRTVLLLLGSGGVFYAISDLLRAAFSAQGSFQFGGPIDVGWMAGYAMFALGARHKSAIPAATTDSPASATPPTVSSAITFGAFLVAALVRVFHLTQTGSTVLTNIVWVVVLLGVLARQALLIIDNESLRRGLERRVNERTNELQVLTQTSQTMLNSVGDGIYGVDQSGVITFVNPSAATMLGHPAGELIGARAHEMFHAPQIDGTAFPYSACYIAEAVEGGILTTSEDDVYLRAHGEPFPVDVTASPMMRHDLVEGAVVVFRDMTQRREVDRLKSEFVSVVSHELRTPLTSIRGSLGLLSAGALGELTPAATRMVKIALDSSERLTRLINDILDIERIESGTMPMHMERHHSVDLVKTAVDQVQTIAASAGVKLQLVATEGQVWADGDRIVQTLVNLLGNAIKFSDQQSVVDVEALAGPDFVTFRVKDQGRGIPADKLDSVFRRFEQVDSSDAREKGGSGLGLAISRSIVERHDGEIWVDSAPGDGATFFFTVPALAAAPAPSREGTTGPAILVCDDDPDFVEVLCAVLVRHGYRAIGVQEGQQAITLAAEELPAAVLIDLMMEGSSGADVVAALRENPRTADIPVVIVSGLEPGDDLQLAVQTDDWLIKPIEEDRLVRALSTAISAHVITNEVLLVEDDEELASVVRALLERRGLHVSHARNRSEAMDMVHGGRPGVLILDLQLPDGSGAEIVHAMRSDQSLADLPAVIYSADNIPNSERDALRLGTTIFMTNGRVSPEQLESRVVELVDLVLGDHRAEHRLSEPV